MSTYNPWFVDISNYLATRNLPQHLSSKEKQMIACLIDNYSWMEGDLYRTWPDLIIHICVQDDKMFEILKAIHDGPWGHFSNKRTIYKCLHSRYYWPTLFKDEKKYVRSCDNFQWMGKLIKLYKMPIHPQLLIEPFEKWALYFVGPITPMSRKKRYILVCTDYVSNG